MSTNTTNIENINNLCSRLVAWNATQSALYGSFADHGILNWFKLGKLLVIGGSVYSSTALTNASSHILVAKSVFPYGITSIWCSAFIGYNDGCSGSVGIFDGYNLCVWPRQGQVPANTYINIIVIGYTSDSV